MVNSSRRYGTADVSAFCARKLTTLVPAVMSSW